MKNLFLNFIVTGPEDKSTQGSAHNTLVLSKGTTLHVHNNVSICLNPVTIMILHFWKKHLS